jgi:hypothetical protein
VNGGVGKGKNEENEQQFRRIGPNAGPEAVDLVFFAHSHRRLVDEGWIEAAKAVAPSGPDCATSRILRRGQGRRNLGNVRRVRPGAAGLGYLIGCSEMGLKVRWSFMALLAVAIVTLTGCAATGPLAGDPCWGFYACTGWH